MSKKLRGVSNSRGSNKTERAAKGEREVRGGGVAAMWKPCPKGCGGQIRFRRVSGGLRIGDCSLCSRTYAIKT